MFLSGGHPPPPLDEYVAMGEGVEEAAFRLARFVGAWFPSHAHIGATMDTRTMSVHFSPGQQLRPGRSGGGFHVHAPSHLEHGHFLAKSLR